MSADGPLKRGGAAGAQQNALRSGRRRAQLRASCGCRRGPSRQAAGLSTHAHRTRPSSLRWHGRAGTPVDQVRLRRLLWFGASKIAPLKLNLPSWTRGHGSRTDPLRFTQSCHAARGSGRTQGGGVHVAGSGVQGVPHGGSLRRGDARALQPPRVHPQPVRVLLQVVQPRVLEVTGEQSPQPPPRRPSPDTPAWRSSAAVSCPPCFPASSLRTASAAGQAMICSLSADDSSRTGSDQKQRIWNQQKHSARTQLGPPRSTWTTWVG